MSETPHSDQVWGWLDAEEHQAAAIPDGPTLQDEQQALAPLVEESSGTPIADKLAEYGITSGRVLGGTAAGLMLLGVSLGVRHLTRKKEEE